MSLQQISQSHLTLLDDCPRKFQYIHLDNLGSLTPSTEQAYLNRGSQIHFLIQQQELQLPLPWIDPIEQDWSSETVELYQVANVLSNAIPAVDKTTRFRQSEYRLHLEFEGMLLTVVYDLLVLTDDHAYIFDWKTYSRPPDRTHLANQWQTRLYPFVLTEASEYNPADVTLAYWFVQPTASHQEDCAPGNQSEAPIKLQPNCIQFDYGDRHHHHTRTSLRQILGRLNQWLAAYDAGEPLPQTPDIQGRCTQCPFALRCERSPQGSQSQWAELENIAAIKEIPLPNVALKSE